MNNNKNNRSLKAVTFDNVKIEDDFWSPRLKTLQEVTLRTCIKKCEDTGRISNFLKAAGKLEGEFEGMFFNDSDVYKVLEGVAYSLVNHPDTELERKADEIIDAIAAAQQQDGYLSNYFTLVKPENKWIDMNGHEDYCGGHLIEAAIAYFKATGKRKFLDTAIKLADHYVAVFGEGTKHWAPGHQEIELALVKLYHETGNARYLKLAQWFLEERGHGHYVFKEGFTFDRDEHGGAPYSQDDKPVRELTDIAGHAVRAMYMYSAIADIAAITGDAGYIVTLDRLWDSTIFRNMYITGGIGSSKYNEGFTGDYDLPNDSAYCETCAAVGMVFWNHRMNLMHGDSKYADILELAMYNGALAGMSQSGDKFFYVNPLETDGSHHREEWFDVSCCPTQTSRFITSIGNYIYTTSDDSIYTNLYIGSTSNIKLKNSKVKLIQKTEYPWQGTVNMTVYPEKASVFGINLRIPGWCRNATVKVNGIQVNNMFVEKGYIVLFREWNQNDVITLKLEMPIEKVVAHPKVKMNEGKLAIKRGPIVYCVEETDNKDSYDKMVITPETELTVERWEASIDGISVIKAKDSNTGTRFTAIPYYAWDNREPGRMKVWLSKEEY